MSVRVPEHACPKCGELLDASSNIDDPTIGPEVGDVTICVHCSQIMVFEEGLSLRKFTSADLEAMPAETARELGRVHETVIAFILHQAKAQRGR